MPTMSQTEIVQGIVKGDETASTALYDQMQAGLHYFFWKQVGPQDAEDCVHDTILAAISAVKRGLLHDPENLRAYIRGIAHRQLQVYIADKTRLRKNIPFDSIDKDDALYALMGVGTLPHFNTVELCIDRKRIVGMVCDAMRNKRFSQRDYAVIVLSFFEGLTSEEVQQELGISKTVYRLTKSRRKHLLVDAVRRMMVPPARRITHKEQTYDAA